MATTINLSLQSQNNSQHVMRESHSLMTFSKLPWKASQLKHPSDTYQYSSRQLQNAFFPLVGNQLRRSCSQQLEVSVDKTSLISRPAQLQPRPSTSCYRKYDPKPSLHQKNVRYHEPFLYPDPLGDTKPELSKFYQRIAKISQLEEDAIKYEESRRKTNSKPATATSATTTSAHLSRSISARTLNKAPSVKPIAKRCAYISINNQSEDCLQSPTHETLTPTISPIASPTCDVTQTDDVVSSPTHTSTADHKVCKPDNEVIAADITSLTHSDKDSNSDTMVCGPVLLCNGQLTTQDYEQARCHLSKSHDQLSSSCNETTRVTSHAQTCKKSAKHRPISATLLLTESSSSTSVSSVCSDRSHVKQNKLRSNKKRHKK